MHVTSNTLFCATTTELWLPPFRVNNMQAFSFLEHFPSGGAEDPFEMRFTPAFSFVKLDGRGMFGGKLGFRVAAGSRNCTDLGSRGTEPLEWLHHRVLLGSP
jgi:hypothetical protein